MGYIPMRGYYLVRGADGMWHAVVPGLENLGSTASNAAINRTATSITSTTGGISRDPWWVRFMDFIRGGLDRPDSYGR